VRWFLRLLNQPSWWIDAVIAAALGAAVVFMVWVVFG
jgi:hypothetical protein